MYSESKLKSVTTATIIINEYVEAEREYPKVFFFFFEIALVETDNLVVP